MDARPFPPSPRRRARAHAQGDVARSPALGAAAALVVVATVAPASIAFARDQLKRSLEALAVEAPPAPIATLTPLAIALLVAPLSLAIAAFAASSFVGGVRFGPPRATPADAQLGRLWSVGRATLIALVLAPLTLVAVARITSLAAWRIATPARALDVTLDGLRRASLVALAFVAVVGVLDALCARASWRRRWSMTRAERELEARESAGDPSARAELRGRARSLTDRA